MLPSNPSLVKVVLDGGILMGPFLLMALIWIACTIRFVAKRPRTMKGLVSLLLFPLIFGIMAIAHWAFHWNTIYKDMEMAGYPDELQHIQRVLVTSRSCLVIVSVAGLSLASGAGMFLLPLSKQRQDEQDGAPNPATRSESELEGG